MRICTSGELEGFGHGLATSVMSTDLQNAVWPFFSLSILVSMLHMAAWRWQLLYVDLPFGSRCGSQACSWAVNVRFVGKTRGPEIFGRMKGFPGGMCLYCLSGLRVMIRALEPG